MRYTSVCFGVNPATSNDTGRRRNRHAQLTFNQQVEGSSPSRPSMLGGS